MKNSTFSFSGIILICISLFLSFSGKSQNNMSIRKTEPAFDTLFLSDSEMQHWYSQHGLNTVNTEKKDSLGTTKKAGAAPHNPLSRTVKRGGHFTASAKTISISSEPAKSTVFNEHFSLSHLPSFKSRKFFQHHSKADFAGGRVQIKNISKNEDVHIVVKDLLGNTLLSKTFSEVHDINHYEVSLNRNNLKSGMYFVSVYKGNETETQNLLIHHFPEHIK